MNKIVFKKDKLSYLIVFCCILFDWRFFEWDPAHFFIYMLKGIIPFFLLIYVSVHRGLIIPRLSEHRAYYALMTIFVFYILLPSLLASDPVGSIEVWERLVFVVFYVYAIGACLIA